MDRVTLAQVAAHAGVSRATASLVLRAEGRISKPVRERVIASMQELGYVYHRGAASLRERRTGTAGVIVTNITNPFFAEMTAGLEAALTDAGLVTLLASTLEDVDRQTRLVSSFLEHAVDGLVVVPALGTPAALVERLVASRVPHLIATRHVPGPDTAYVGGDDTSGGELVARHLLEHGCRRLAYVGGVTTAGPRRDRLKGMENVRERWEAPTASTVVLPGESNGRAGIALAQDLLRLATPPDGIVCHTDAIAFGLCRALRDAGVRVGEDVRVASFDGTEHTALWEPPLTTVTCGPAALGQRTAAMLLRQIAAGATPGEPATGPAPGTAPGTATGPVAGPVSEMVPMQLVVRRSCGCP